ncbi:hypothetical protein ABK040_004105 [Willaertia magna]
MSFVQQSSTNKKKRKQAQTTLQFPTTSSNSNSTSNNNNKPTKKKKKTTDEIITIEDDNNIPISKPSPTTNTKTSSSDNLVKKMRPLNNASGFTNKTSSASSGGGLTNSSPTMIGNSLGSNQKRTLKIKPFTIKQFTLENFEQETWEKLKSAVIAIQQQKAFSIGQEELYKSCEDMCKHKLASSLYEKLKDVCSIHTNQIIKNLCNTTPESTAFLNIVVKCWEEFTEQMKSIRSIFLYLDRTYVIQNSDVKSLWDMGLQLFRYYLKQYEQQVEKKVIAGLLHLIHQERSGNSIDRSIVQRLTRMLMALQLYEEDFEKRFLDETRDFYSTEGKNQIEVLNVPEYLLHIETRLRQESERASNFLSRSTKKPLISIVEKELIKQHAKSILDRGFDELMDSHRIMDLSRLYGLFKIVNELDILKEYFTNYMKIRGRRIVEDEENEKNMVQDTLSFKAKIDEIFEQSFHKNEDFKHCIRKAFEHFLNLVQNKPSELIAKYIDSKLKSGNKGLTEEELERCMDNALVIFKYIQGKDIFEAFYKKDLAKRLLSDRCSSYDAEKTMIAKLRTECGTQFSNKLEGMFKDVDVSKDLMSQYKKSKEYNKLCKELVTSDNMDIEEVNGSSDRSPFDLNVTVLTISNWPNYKFDALNIPKELSLAQDSFRDFYINKHSGRTLRWVYYHGQCTLRALFPSDRKELIVGLYHAVTLLQFNDQEKLTYKELKQATGIEDDVQFKLTLQALTFTKIKVLKKETKGTEINEDDVFFVNDQFSHPLTKIKINSLQLKESKKERQDTTEKVLLDRQYVIDAAVVRIMKSRKTLAHQALITEVLKQLRFPTTGQEIKKRIESLIERDYIARESKDSNISGSANCEYKYLA